MRLPCGAPLQCCPHLLLQGGELRAVVRTDDAGIGRPAGLGMPDQVGVTPVRAAVVTPFLLGLGVQGGQPRTPAEGEKDADREAGRSERSAVFSSLSERGSMCRQFSRTS